MNAFTAGSVAFLNGEEVEVQTNSKGWVTVIKNDGSTAKVRASSLTPQATEADVAASEEAAAKLAAKQAKADEKAAKEAAKAEARAAREAEKQAKIEAKAAAKAAREEAAARRRELIQAGEDPRLVKPDLTRYTIHKEQKTASGRPAIDTDDEIARELRGLDLLETYSKAATVLGIPEEQLRAQYEHLNPGMQRMNLGNRIRGHLRGAEARKLREEAKAKREALAAEAKAKREAEQATKEAAKAAAKAEREAAKAAAKAAKEAEKQAA